MSFWRGELIKVLSRVKAVEDTLPLDVSIHAAAATTTPVDADEFVLADSANSFVAKKVTWANIKATLKTYFDTLYQPLATRLTSWAAVVRASGFDTFAATPSSANLIALLTDETGTGAAVFANTPTLVTPALGAATGTSVALTAGFSTSLNPATGPAINTAGNAASLAQNAEIVLSNHSGLLVIIDHTNGAVGVVSCGGGTVTVISAGPGAQYVNTSTPSTSQTGIYFSSTYRIRHGFAANHTYGVLWLSARNAV